MTGVDSYSTTANNNATTDGGSQTWAEQQFPSTVNNSARLLLKDVRDRFNDLPWFQYGNGDQDTGTHLAKPCLYSSATAFTVAGNGDQTAYYHTGRPIRAVGTTTGTIYGAISSSSYNAGNDTNTVNVTWISGTLQSETLVISAGLPVYSMPLAASSITFNLLVRAGDAHGSALLTGEVDEFKTDFAFTITGVGVDNDASGSVTWDIRINSFVVDSQPSVGNSIVASAPPKTASHQSSSDTTLTGWTTAVAASSTVRFVLTAVDSVVKRSTLSLRCTRSLAA